MAELLQVDGRNIVIERARLHEVMWQDPGTPNPLLWFVTDRDADGDLLSSSPTKREALERAGLGHCAAICGCAQRAIAAGGEGEGT